MVNVNPADDFDLLCQLKDGNEIAFTKLFHRYQDRVYQFCLRFTRSSAVAQEWMQDTFVQVWQHKVNIDPNKSFSGYLHVIARNKALDHIRKSSAITKQQDQWLRMVPANDDSSHYFSEVNDLRRITEKAIAQLPSQRRKIYRMSREEGLSHKVIADQLDLSQGTIKHQMVLSLRFLRRYLQNYFF